MAARDTVCGSFYASEKHAHSFLQTASTLTFAMYMMTQHPDMAQRIREEVLKTVGQARPTYEDMKNMKYLRAFINGTYLTS